MERLFYRRSNTIVDFDDLWVNRLADADLPTPKRKFRYLLQAAVMVTAANPQLADAIRSISGRAATILPNAIDVDRFRVAANPGAAIRSPIRIGWIGTPYTAARYLPSITPVLNRLSAERVSVTRLIGAGDAVPDLAAERLSWTLQGEAVAVAALDVGVMPLGRTAFDACKSGWKALQYMAAGRPVVATRVGYTTELIKDGVNGYLVETEGEWESRLRQLAAEPALRAQLGAAAQTMTAREFSRRASIERLAESMQSIT
jgi:glycosyltransferase involved in cell wall biosynthesis